MARLLLLFLLSVLESTIVVYSFVISTLTTNHPSSSVQIATAKRRNAPLGATSESPPDYSTNELKEALDSLWKDSSSDADVDAGHIFGYKDPNHELSMLQKITATRILDYQQWIANPKSPSLDELVEQAHIFAKEHGDIINLQNVIQKQAPRMALAAEFKRASPSKGDIALHVEAGHQAKLYTDAGANILSVLTEQHWFRGSLNDLQSARITTTSSSNNTRRPAILRKDFVISKYMIAEAAARGADTVLLIVAILPRHLLIDLIQYSRSLGMEPLVEIHADIELDVALSAGARVIGVNNRNLHTFQMSMERTSQVAQILQQEKSITIRHEQEQENNDENKNYYTLCALSGMSTSMDVHRYRQDGVGMCLIGESLMRASDPRQAIASLCLDPDDYAATTNANNNEDSSSSLAGAAYTAGTKLVKICGITNSQDALVACRAGANLIGVIFAEKSKRRVTVQQAKEIVSTVRAFGERTTTTNAQTADNDNENKNKDPLQSLITTSKHLEETSRRTPLVVGVFQNQDSNFIRNAVETAGLDLVQLHGSEGMKACSDTGGVPAIRVVDIQVNDNDNDNDTNNDDDNDDAVDTLLNSLTSDPAAILLDTSIKGSGGGGTGITFDWTLAEKIQARGLPVIIAGGLDPDNVAQCVSTARPWGIDTSSGVEQDAGIKNHDKVSTFIRQAREASVKANQGF